MLFPSKISLNLVFFLFSAQFLLAPKNNLEDLSPSGSTAPDGFTAPDGSSASLVKARVSQLEEQKAADPSTVSLARNAPVPLTINDPIPLTINAPVPLTIPTPVGQKRNFLLLDRKAHPVPPAILTPIGKNRDIPPPKDRNAPFVDQEGNVRNVIGKKPRFVRPTQPEQDDVTTQEETETETTWATITPHKGETESGTDKKGPGTGRKTADGYLSRKPRGSPEDILPTSQDPSNTGLEKPVVHQSHPIPPLGDEKTEEPSSRDDVLVGGPPKAKTSDALEKLKRPFIRNKSVEPRKKKVKKLPKAKSEPLPGKHSLDQDFITQLIGYIKKYSNSDVELPPQCEYEREPRPHAICRPYPPLKATFSEVTKAVNTLRKDYQCTKILLRGKVLRMLSKDEYDIDTMGLSSAVEYYLDVGPGCDFRNANGFEQRGDPSQWYYTIVVQRVKDVISEKVVD